MATVLTGPEVARLRLAAQRLVGPRTGSPTDVVRLLLAAQAQDLPGALTSVALRSTARARAAVEAALGAGELVRSWPMRGTLHLVAAEDLGWMLDLTTERLVAGAAARRAGLGLSDDIIERARQLAVEELRGGRRCSRAELLSVWEEAGLLGVPQRSYHLIWHLAQTGTLCFGPVRDGEQDLVLLTEWVTSPRRLQREEALGEWALRYFTGHGPARVADFTRWTGLRAADVKTGVALARPSLAVVAVDGVEHLMDPTTPDRSAAAGAETDAVLLLPGFDELMLGYGDRSSALAPEFAERIVPGRNGVFQPTVVVGGQVVGTWRRVGSGSRRRVVATPFTTFDDETAAAVEKAAAHLP